MSNLRHNIVVKGVILTIFLLITGVFVAVAEVDDRLEASWTESGIKAEAWYLMTDKYYQIRYYQPETFPEGELTEYSLWSDENTDVENEDLTGPYNASENPDGFYVRYPKFPSGDGFNETDPYTETFTDIGVNGWYLGEEWTVALMKAGDSDSSDQFTYANSHRVHCPVVPIPEFSTIALPIAAILGIMFILQSRRRKED